MINLVVKTTSKIPARIIRAITLKRITFTTVERFQNQISKIMSGTVIKKNGFIR